MAFSVRKLVPLVFASASVAVPTTQHVGNSRTVKFKETSETAATVDSPIWAGALLEESGVTSAVGTFTLPNVSMPDGGDPSTSYCGSAWVGIDGVTNVCVNGALMQSGVSWCIQNGVTTYTPWYEYWPAEAQEKLLDFDVSVGDEIQVTIATKNTTSGTATLENLSTGGSISHTWSDMSPALCFDTAEWVVEDFEVGDETVAFADFGTVTWTNVSALVNGTTVEASTAHNMDMVTSNGTYATSSISGDDVAITCAL
jgi:Peptidase A4 family